MPELFVKSAICLHRPIASLILKRYKPKLNKFFYDRRQTSLAFVVAHKKVDNAIKGSATIVLTSSMTYALKFSHYAQNPPHTGIQLYIRVYTHTTFAHKSDITAMQRLLSQSKRARKSTTDNQNMGSKNSNQGSIFSYLISECTVLHCF